MRASGISRKLLVKRESLAPCLSSLQLSKNAFWIPTFSEREDQNGENWVTWKYLEAFKAASGSLSVSAVRLPKLLPTVGPVAVQKCPKCVFLFFSSSKGN